jgi:predicted double-glycine peptidase
MDREIYLKQQKVSPGCGSTANATVIEDDDQGVKLDEGCVEIQMLDMDDKPFWGASVISRAKNPQSFLPL